MQKRTDDSILRELDITRGFFGHVRKRKLSYFGHLCRDHGCYRWWPTITHDLRKEAVGARTPRSKCCIAGPQEGVCNWCGQLGGRRVGKRIIIITCADPVHSGAILSCAYEEVFFSLQINPIMNVIMMIPTKTIAPKIILFTNIISEDAIHAWSLPVDDHLMGIVVYFMKMVRRPLLTFVVT